MENNFVYEYTSVATKDDGTPKFKGVVNLSIYAKNAHAGVVAIETEGITRFVKFPSDDSFVVLAEDIEKLIRNVLGAIKPIRSFTYVLIGDTEAAEKLKDYTIAKVFEEAFE